MTTNQVTCSVMISGWSPNPFMQRSWSFSSQTSSFSYLRQDKNKNKKNLNFICIFVLPLANAGQQVYRLGQRDGKPQETTVIQLL